ETVMLLVDTLSAAVRPLGALALCATVSFAQCVDWQPGFGSALEGPYDSVYSAVAFDDGTGPALYVGGAFRAFDGFAANRLVRWKDAAWSALEAPDNSATFDVTALTVFDDGHGPALYEGRTYRERPYSYTAVAGRVARWDGSEWALVG